MSVPQNITQPLKADWSNSVTGSELHQPLEADCFAFPALRQARFFSLIISDSAVGLMSYRPVIIVWTNESDAMDFVRGSASITLVSIHLG